MQDWSDSVLDNCIRDALQSAVVTPQQKRAAWQALHERAMRQTALTPLEVAKQVPDVCVNHRRGVSGWVSRAWRWTQATLLDDSSYDRAFNQRRLLQLSFFCDSPLRNMVGGAAT